MRWMLAVLSLSLILAGCETFPKDALKLSPESLKKREWQTREFRGANEEQILSACVGVLQDFGFTLDESETKLGVLFASKDRDFWSPSPGPMTASSPGGFYTTVGGHIGIGGPYLGSGYYGNDYWDSYLSRETVQKLRACIVVREGEEKKRVLVRVTFQRIIWNRRGDISRAETLDDPRLYQDFFDRLSKSVFLEASMP